MAAAIFDGFVPDKAASHAPGAHPMSHENLRLLRNDNDKVLKGLYNSDSWCRASATVIRGVGLQPVCLAHEIRRVCDFGVRLAVLTG